MPRFFTAIVAVTLATCIGTTARSQTNQAGGAAAANSAGSQAGAQAPALGFNAAGQTRGGVGTTPPAVSEANPIASQNPALAANAAGQARGGFGDQTGFVGFNGISQVPLFADPRVQQELGLSQEDLAFLSQAQAENWSRYNQGVLGIGNNLPAQQRLMEMQRLRAMFNDGFGQTVNSTITNPELLQRFNQLNLQFQNFGAFNDPVIRSQLRLAPQQQRQIRRLGNEFRNELRRLRRAGNDIDPQLAEQQFQQMQAAVQASLNQVLTPEQQQTWNGLTGERFQFSRTSFVPPNEDFREELLQKRIIPHAGIDNAAAQDQPVRRNVTPHSGRQSAQRQSGNTVR